MLKEFEADWNKLFIEFVDKYEHVDINIILKANQNYMKHF